MLLKRLPLCLQWNLLPLDGGLDRTMRLVDGHKDVVGIVLAEGAQIRKQMMQVGHGKMNARDLRRGVERGFAHVEERVLHAHAIVCGKCFEQRGDDARREPAHSPAMQPHNPT